RSWLMEKVRRDTLITPELAEISKIVAPRIAAKGPATSPAYGIRWARCATGSSIGTVRHGITPNVSVEKASAKMNTVKISVSEVRGMIVAGRRVSCAACEMDSSPTNEIIASEEPYMKWCRVGNSWRH